MKKILSFITASVKGIKEHWHEPKDGDYVSNKEIVAFSCGGIGVKTMTAINGNIQMTPTCLLMGAVYGLSPSQLILLFIIANVIGILKTPLASWIIDNTDTKYGKLRPYMLWAAAPCILGIIGVTWLIPLDSSVSVKMVLIAVFYNVYLIGQQIYGVAYIGLSQVISPKSAERNKIMSISELIANFGPSILQLAIPVLAQIFFGRDGLLKLEAYRVLLPAFAFLGFGLSLLIMFKTKERAIIPKAEKQRVKFIDGIRFAGTNLDFWIVSISKFFEGFKVGIGLLLAWICLYQLESSAMFGILPTITSVAVVPGMILAPLLMSKFGSGKAAFSANILNALAALIMLLTFKSGIIFFVVALFMYNFASGPQYIMQTSITADALDEIQLKSRERLEGFVQNFQLMFGILGSIVANLLFMIIYEHFGLAAGEDGLTDYNILRNPEIRNSIITNIIIIGLIASLISAIPFLFIKMTRDKHKQIIFELEQRKLIEDKKETISEENNLT